MKVSPIRTKAEQQLLTQFEAVADTLPGARWVRDARRAAIGAFATTGLPHRRLEAWKYTDLRALMTEAFPPVAEVGSGLDAAALAAALGPELAGLRGSRYVFLDGKFVVSLESPRPEGSAGGHQFADAAAVLAKPGMEWLGTPVLGKATDVNPLLALNAAFAADGAVLDIKRDHTDPIHLIFLYTSSKSRAATTLNLIRVESGARATILETHIGIAGVSRQNNSALHLTVGQEARVEHVKLIADGARSFHLGTTEAQVEAGGIYRAFQLTKSPLLARNDVNVTFKGESASFQFNAAFLARGKSHIDTTMVIDHAVPRCTSREVIKGVLDDDSRGIFQGKVIVRPDAQKSDGKQSARALLLSPNAEFDSKPELEIHADDVICGHGSTAAELDGDQIFYLRARGIPEPQARALLIEAFAAEAIEAIEHEAIRQAMRARLQAWLTKVGA